MTKAFIGLLMTLVITGSIVLPATVDAKAYPSWLRETRIAEAERAALRTEVIDALTGSLKLPTPNPGTVNRQNLLCDLLMTGAQGRDQTRLLAIQSEFDKRLKAAQE